MLHSVTLAELPLDGPQARNLPLFFPVTIAPHGRCVVRDVSEYGVLALKPNGGDVAHVALERCEVALSDPSDETRTERGFRPAGDPLPAVIRMVVHAMAQRGLPVGLNVESQLPDLFYDRLDDVWHFSCSSMGWLLSDRPRPVRGDVLVIPGIGDRDETGRCHASPRRALVHIIRAKLWEAPCTPET